ncbi:serine/threonine-protein kinase [Knoellia aerolata]|uniref:non-specific serine/threonine protein kinase n=1 Tax=Knoellia aerolata DSM 18566 TaxID=1385519 RepID=A0A0A0JWR2_9MICO|nr:serine/threonine-protein kinase [Knoellia aerolata]KGN41139.1 hypothetical protein N801_09210 [Knoellia aerolata DSM 18566]
MGEVFAGRYELLDPLGEGGMGTVWRVWDAREERIVAAKVLRQSDAVSLLRFVREQAFRVVHPHVLTPLSWAGEDDRVLFTMPVVEGGSVASLIGDHGPLPPGLVAEVLRQLSRALDAVHTAGILHRDVKPANVLLAATGQERPHAFLTDFGIAIELDGVRLTQTGQWSGTPSYTAPESLSGAEPHPSADLYAVGRVGVAMLTGERPTDLPTRPDGTPAELWQLLTDLTRQDPDARPQAADDVLRRLDAPALVWRSGSMGEVEVLRHVPEPAPGLAQLTARPGEVPTGAGAAAATPSDADATRVRRDGPPPATAFPTLAPETVTGAVGGPRAARPPSTAPGPRWGRPRTAVVSVAAVAAVLTLAVGLGIWSPWSADPDTSPPSPGGASSTAPETATSAPETATSAPAASPTPTATPAATPTTRGSVTVGSVVVAPGQPCQFSDVGVREQTVDGVPVVCQRRADGSYAWVRPAG